MIECRPSQEYHQYPRYTAGAPDLVAGLLGRGALDFGGQEQQISTLKCAIKCTPTTRVAFSLHPFRYVTPIRIKKVSWSSCFVFEQPVVSSSVLRCRISQTLLFFSCHLQPSVKQSSWQFNIMMISSECRLGWRSTITSCVINIIILSEEQGRDRWMYYENWISCSKTASIHSKVLCSAAVHLSSTALVFQVWNDCALSMCWVLKVQICWTLPDFFGTRKLMEGCSEGEWQRLPP